MTDWWLKLNTRTIPCLLRKGTNAHIQVHCCITGKTGILHCVFVMPLFESKLKFDSGCGWVEVSIDLFPDAVRYEGRS